MAEQALQGQVGNLLAVLGVSEHGGINAASRASVQSVSGVSRAVASLEQVVGCRLFERTAQGMYPTESGGLLLRRARRIRAEFDKTADALVIACPNVRSLNKVRLLSVLGNGRKLAMLSSIFELRSIGGAAQAAGVTQAGISMALARIEQALDIKLVTRCSNRADPTEALEIISAFGAWSSAELRHLEADLASLSGEVSGTIIVGSTPLARACSLPSAIGRCIDKHPKIRVRSVEGPYGRLCNQLRFGEIDMLLCVLRSDDLGGELVGEYLLVDHLSFLVGSGHPLACRDDVGFADLLDAKWILPRPQSISLDAVRTYFESSGLQAPRASVETGDLATLRELLARDDFIAIASARQLEVEIRDGSVLELPLTFDGAVVNIGLITRASSELPRAGTVLAAEVRRALSRVRS
jgi:LysR family transcriptional regulator of gallate degradation